MLNIEEEELSDLKLITGSKCNFELDKKVDFFSRIMASDANQNWR